MTAGTDTFNDRTVEAPYAVPAVDYWVGSTTLEAPPKDSCTTRPAKKEVVCLS